MGLCFRIFIIDEMDWNYVDFDRSEVVKQVKKIIPWAELEADIPNMMIFDIDKSPPQLLFDKITCDKIMYQYDNERLKIYDLIEGF